MENYFQELTNRPLLREARQTIERYLDIKQMKKSGSKYYLGDPIGFAYLEIMKEITNYKNEVVNRYDTWKWQEMVLEEAFKFKTV